MTNTFARLLVVLLMFTLCYATESLGGPKKAPLQRHAKINALPEDVRSGDSVPEEAVLPRWLDQLLARSIPEARTENLQKEFEATVTAPEPDASAEHADPFFPRPSDIPPLYTSPVLDGEGHWTTKDLPKGQDGTPLFYKTVYRPSAEFPNAVVYMAIFDMKRLKPRFFIGETEPGIYQVSHSPEREDLSKIVAITNAMWMQQHARGAGAIFRGQVVYPMVPGMATLVIYQDDSVDIVEWSDDIPIRLVKDARQLRHLIVKDSMVVEKVCKNGKVLDSEIGLGGFLVDDSGRSTMSSKFWFLANRTAFGIREDGNLVFAMGHHVGTKDLAKALVLAGCKRAIHGDANKHNTVCNFYFRDEQRQNRQA